MRMRGATLPGGAAPMKDVGAPSVADERMWAMFLLLEHNDDAVLTRVVERRICELRRILRQEKLPGDSVTLQHELAALERVMHRLHESCYDVTC